VPFKLSQPDWGELGARFQSIAHEHGPTTIKAVGDYSADSRYGDWSVTDCRNENLQVRFELAATRAGKELDSPHGVRPFNYWLDRLFVNVTASHGKRARHVVVSGPPVKTFANDPSSKTIKFIEDACTASATFCARLEMAQMEGSTEDLLLRDIVTTALPDLEAPEEARAVESRSDPRAECKRKRRDEIAAFLANCNKHSSDRILKRHIWLCVGHSKARQFERWQACEEAATDADKRNFARILAMEPGDFIAALRKKDLL
jgi:hypothetical protein